MIQPGFAKPIAILCSLMAALLVAGCNIGASPPDENAEAESAAQTFQFEFSGGVSGTAQGQAFYIPPESGGAVITLNSTQPDLQGATVSLVIPAGTAPGTYPLNNYFSAFDTQGRIISFSAAFSQIISNEVDVIDLYGMVSSGSLTLSAVEPYSGSFEFTAAQAEGQATVTVKGTMTAIPMLAG